MSELRTRMLRDMTVRGLAPRTLKAYIAAVARLAQHYRRSPDQITDDEVQTYLAHLIHDRKLSWSTCSQAANAFRFLYHVTLGRPRTEFVVPLPKQPQKLPEILSREEVWRLLTASPHPRHRLILAVVYAAGLRVSEAIALKVSDIDADRMTVRIAQGKGAKDRYVPARQALAPGPARVLEDEPARRVAVRQSAGDPAHRRHHRAEDLHDGEAPRRHPEARRHSRAPPRLRYASPRSRDRSPHRAAPAGAPPHLDHPSLLPSQPRSACRRRRIEFNTALERAAGSPPLATAAHRQRYANKWTFEP